MPFDNTPARPCHAEEIAILDRMAELLAAPERWKKGDFALLRNDQTPERMCLVGTLTFVELDTPFGTIGPNTAAERVLDALKRALPKEWRCFEPEDFNDHRKTRHADILALIARARAEFVRDQERGDRHVI